MSTRLRSIILRYGLPAVSFAVIILITQALKRYFGFAFDPNLLLIGVFIASAWYGGAGPGLLVVLECELTIQYLSPPQSLSLKFFLLMLNRLALLVAFVLFVSSRRKAQQRIEEERDRVEAERERLRVSL